MHPGFELEAFNDSRCIAFLRLHYEDAHEAAFHELQGPHKAGKRFVWAPCLCVRELRLAPFLRAARACGTTRAVCGMQCHAQ